MKSAVVVFPGSNCDRDVFTIMQQHQMGPSYVWHGDASLPDDLDLIVLPGGFSYGDYLRCGAMASKSPIMQDVIRFANKGGTVLGICNGFQVLTESGLLPGTLMRNNHLRFNCKETTLRVDATDTPFTAQYKKGQVINLPIAHAEGNYFADEATLNQLESNNQIVFRYVNDDGKPTDESNPNGSQHNIAGIMNASKNVLGLMPHPERHSDPETGGTDGVTLFASLLSKLN